MDKTNMYNDTTSTTWKLLNKLGIHLSSTTYGQISLVELLKKTVRFWTNDILQKIAFNSVILTPAPIAARIVIPMLHRWRGVRIGKNCLISNLVSIDSVYPELISIGDNVLIASSCQFIAHQRDLSDYEGNDDLINNKGYVISKITVEDNVMIGSGSIILPGVRIGKGAVVAAGSVVRKDVPSNTLVAGTPAKVIKVYSKPDNR